MKWISLMLKSNWLVMKWMLMMWRFVIVLKTVKVKLDNYINFFFAKLTSNSSNNACTVCLPIVKWSHGQWGNDVVLILTLSMISHVWLAALLTIRVHWHCYTWSIWAYVLFTCVVITIYICSYLSILNYVGFPGGCKGVMENC